MLRNLILHTLQIGLITIFVGGLADAQKIVKTLTASDYYKRGSESLENGDYENAIDDFGQAIRMKPRNPEYFLSVENVSICFFKWKKRMKITTKR